MGHKFVATIPVPDLNVPDHPLYIVRVLVDMIHNQWRPTSAQHEQLVQHLDECLYCKRLLQAWLRAELDYDKEHGISDESGQHLLAQLEQIIHEADVREEMAAYIEIIDEQGEAAAKATFPHFAEHLNTCQACCIALKETRALLRLLEQAESPPGEEAETALDDTQTSIT